MAPESPEDIAPSVPARKVGRRRPGRPSDQVGTRNPWIRWLGEPRSFVFLILASVFIVGGGRRLLQGLRARNAVLKLEGDDVDEAAIAEAARHGRSGLIDLFRILGTHESASLRDAAGRALAGLWAQDNLVAEEEKALVRRGFVATWRARRRYPRALTANIPIAVSYGVPFLVEGEGVGPSSLEWSHRILGAQRAGLESFSEWKAGPGAAEFEIVPGDFDTNGPHKLVLHARVRTVGLTEPWELELPQIPFSFEFDPRLEPGSLYTLPDATRAESIARALRLEPSKPEPSGASRYLDLNHDLVVQDPPQLVADPSLASDLAHLLEVELEGIPGRFVAGTVVFNAQGGATASSSRPKAYDLGPFASIPADLIVQPGTRKIRAILTPDPNLGWADPDVRSLWPGTIETDWTSIRIVRR